jgi:hypothetical protein
MSLGVHNAVTSSPTSPRIPPRMDILASARQIQQTYRGIESPITFLDDRENDVIHHTAKCIPSSLCANHQRVPSLVQLKWRYQNKNKKYKLRGLSRERTIPTERPPLVNEVSANFCG